MTSERPAQGGQRIRLGVTALAWLNLYQTLKQIVQDAIAPEIQGIKGDIRALESRMQGLETQIEARMQRLETRIEARLQGLDGRMQGLETQVAALRTELRAFEDRTEKRFDQMNRQWELAVEVRERLATVEAQLKHR